MFGIIGTALGLSIMAGAAGSICRSVNRSFSPRRYNHYQRYRSPYRYPKRSYNYKPYYNKNNNYKYHHNTNHIHRNDDHTQKKRRDDYWKLRVI